jgi:hypothetical protein
MLTIHDLYGSDCQTKLDLANGLYQNLGERLKTEPIRQSLTLLKGMAQELADQMITMGLGRVCSVCAAKPNGGCCSRAIADENDTIQLLMNLLAGIPVALCRDNDQECLFLGDTGCTLSFKPIFCLNYDCQSIKECANGEETSRYHKLRGTLLQEQWRLEQLLLERLVFLGKFK